MAIDMNKMRARQTALKNKGGEGNNSFWRPQEGEQTVRIVTPSDGDPFRDYWFHYEVGNEKGFLSPKRNFGEEHAVALRFAKFWLQTPISEVSAECQSVLDRLRLYVTDVAANRPIGSRKGSEAAVFVDNVIAATVGMPVGTETMRRGHFEPDELRKEIARSMEGEGESGQKYVNGVKKCKEQAEKMKLKIKDEFLRNAVMKVRKVVFLKAGDNRMI